DRAAPPGPGRREPADVQIGIDDSEDERAQHGLSVLRLEGELPGLCAGRNHHVDERVRGRGDLAGLVLPAARPGDEDAELRGRLEAASREVALPAGRGSRPCGRCASQRSPADRQRPDLGLHLRRQRRFARDLVRGLVRRLFGYGFGAGGDEGEDERDAAHGSEDWLHGSEPPTKPMRRRAEILSPAPAGPRDGSRMRADPFQQRRQTMLRRLTRVPRALAAGAMSTAGLAALALSAATNKPPLHARRWMAITGKPLAATAGAMVFQKGGNAVDAAAAMIAATCTMWDTLSWGGETQA